MLFQNDYDWVSLVMIVMNYDKSLRDVLLWGVLFCVAERCGEFSTALLCC